MSAATRPALVGFERVYPTHRVPLVWYLKPLPGGGRRETPRCPTGHEPAHWLVVGARGEILAAGSHGAVLLEAELAEALHEALRVAVAGRLP